ILLLKRLRLAPRRRPPVAARFPYTTLFRSAGQQRQRGGLTGAGAAEWAALSSSDGAAVRSYLSATSWTPGIGLQSRSGMRTNPRSEEHTSELQSRENLVCRLLLEKKKHITV